MVRLSASQHRVYSYADASRGKDITMPPKRPMRAHGNEPETTNREDVLPQLPALPSLERIQHELASATNLNDFFGKDGIFAHLFATTVEQMLEADRTYWLSAWFEPINVV